jgi:hypothetical protein
VRFIASGRSGHTDTAERQEDLLWGDLDPHGRPAPVVAKPVRARRRVSARRPRARRR